MKTKMKKKAESSAQKVHNSSLSPQGECTHSQSTVILLNPPFETSEKQFHHVC